MENLPLGYNTPLKCLSCSYSLMDTNAMNAKSAKLDQNNQNLWRFCLRTDQRRNGGCKKQKCTVFFQNMARALIIFKWLSDQALN